MSVLRYKTIVYSAKQASATIFFINSFKTPGRAYVLFFRQLNRLGFTVYVYNYRSRPLLYATPQQWIDFSNSIAADIAARIRTTRASNPAARFGMVGVSVGSVMALHVAKKLPELERVMLVSIYGSNAQQTWEHHSLAYMRKYFAERNITLEEAAAAFGELEPTHNLQLLGSRPLLVFASKTDKVIRFANTQILLTKAKEMGINLTLHMLRTRRHSITNIAGLMSGRVWGPFLMPLLETVPSARPAPGTPKVVEI